MTKQQKFFCFFYCLVRPFLAIWHPFLKVTGRENIPAGGCLVVGNHSADSDPLWAAFALKRKNPVRVMAKMELMKIPILGKILKSVGVFGVDRGNTDLTAIKTALRCLKDGEKLLLFPEGTRVKPGKTVEPKTGAALLATRTDSLVLPVYIPVKKRPFCPLHVVIGQPYRMEFAGRRATAEELETLTAEMMRKIYALGEQA